MRKTFYEKRGRRYHPVSQYDSALSYALPAGAHLIVVEPGLRSTLHNVEPDAAPLLAALRMCREQITAEVRKAVEARQAARGKQLTERERMAFQAYKDMTGVDSMAMEFPSIAEIVDKLEAALLKHAKQA